LSLPSERAKTGGSWRYGKVGLARAAGGADSEGLARWPENEHEGFTQLTDGLSQKDQGSRLKAWRFTRIRKSPRITPAMEAGHGSPVDD
jgi:hypothetical protein